jgi:hypothetical protein
MDSAATAPARTASGGSRRVTARAWNRANAHDSLPESCEAAIGRVTASRRRWSSLMTIEMARSFFLWGTSINYGLLVVWSLLFHFAHDGLFRLIGKWVRLSAEQFAMLNVAGMTLYKIGIFLLYLVPLIVLSII